MAASLTSADLAERTRRAAAAALAAGRALGLPAEKATILHDAFSVVAHLEPSPVVARVQVVLPPGMTRQAQAERQQRELDVVAWLDRQGAPVVAPASRLPRSPVRRDGFGMTFWELADVADDHEPYSAVSMTHTATLHAALAGYPHELPFLTPFNRSLGGMVDKLDAAVPLLPSDIRRVRSEYAVLRSVLADRAAFRSRFPDVEVQTIHGDGPALNVIRTTDGVRFSDFEDVTCGPVEWDLALAGPEAVAEYDDAARARGMRATNSEVQRLVDAAATLMMISCVSLIPQLPLLAEGLMPVVESWREAPSLT
ncbi:phosphotransferase family protein [Mycolicibacterium sp. HK-90]|uniref:phosphotransferase family protein n=1 Tax=Mycolicibacterium sp. HK-90 TaxID=3056937 RepID=UPI002657E3AA|nr:phosphotransferase [Mycolicibacterium sp. HK-90]WKG01593.1 phosphotransferase [Mycolicibacterium sp. HK-90]